MLEPENEPPQPPPPPPPPEDRHVFTEIPIPPQDRHIKEGEIPTKPILKEDKSGV